MKMSVSVFLVIKNILYYWSLIISNNVLNGLPRKLTIHNKNVN